MGEQRFTLTSSTDTTPEMADETQAWANRDPGADDAPAAPVDDAQSPENAHGADDDAASEAPEAEEAPTRAERRIKQLLDQRNEARDAVRYGEVERARLEERVRLLEARGQEPQAGERPLVRPDRDDYDTEAEYEDAYEVYLDARADRRQAARDAEQRAAEQRDAAAVQAEQTQARIARSQEAARDAHLDYDERLRAAAEPLSELGRYASTLLEDPGEVFYHLATHPDVLRNVNSKTDLPAVVGELVAIQHAIRAEQREKREQSESSEGEAPGERPRVRRESSEDLRPLRSRGVTQAERFDPYEATEMSAAQYRKYVESLRGT